MKCVININKLYKDLKQVFADKSAKGYADDCQIMQVGNEVILARRYTTSKSLRPITKTCVFSNELLEDLDKPLAFDFIENFLMWIKYADDIDYITLTTEGYRCRIEYITPCGEGVVKFGMDERIKSLIDIGQSKQLEVSMEDIKLMKNFTYKGVGRPPLDCVYFDGGIMVATDTHVLKIRDTKSTYTGLISKELEEVEGDYVNYKSVLPTGDKNKYAIHCKKKEFVKFLKQWSKEDTTSNHLIILCVSNSKLYAKYRDVDHSISKEKELWSQDNIEEGFEIGFDMQILLKILQDKDLNEEFDLRIGDNHSAVIIPQDNSLWLIMPIMI